MDENEIKNVPVENNSEPVVTPEIPVVPVTPVAPEAPVAPVQPTPVVPQQPVQTPSESQPVYYTPPVQQNVAPTPVTPVAQQFNVPVTEPIVQQHSFDNAQTVTPVSPVQPAYSSNGAPVQPQPPKKSKKALKIIIIVVVICAIVAAACVGVSLAGKSNSNSSSSSSSQSNEDAQVKVQSSDSAQLKNEDGDYTVAGVASDNIDSCVLISVYTNQSAYGYLYGYGSNSGSSSSSLSGEGSGVIMSESGGKTYIMTCAHVISDGSSFKVTTNDGTSYDATMVGADTQTDIGVLSIDATGLKVATFGDSDDIVVGEQCVAIGCPGGSKFMNSVATGIVSALDRPVSSSIGYNNECIQTDTAINPGNSGGALFNMQGQVIGINSSKIASTEYEGMGFAVPSNTAVSTANSLISNGYVAGRAKLGITYASLSNTNSASTIVNILEEKGYKDAEGTIIVSSVNSDSDLANKDVQQYDLIIAIDDEVLTSTDVLTSKLSKCSPGDTVKLTMGRISGNDIEIFEVDCKLIESKS